MAIVYDATITPGKRDLMKAWLPGHDPVAVSALLTAIATGGHEATVTMERDGETVTFEPTCRVRGSGSASDALTVGAVTVLDEGDPTVVRAGGHELVVARIIGPGVTGRGTLTATWGGGEPVVLAAIR